MAEEEDLDACCSVCGSIWHDTDNHGLEVAGFGAGSEFPPGYDPAEADRLIGRDVDAS